MANSFLTDDIITLEALSIFENELVAAKALTTRKYEAIFGTHGGSNRSDTIRVRKPNQYTVRSGRTFSAQDITDEYVTFAVDTQIGVDTQVYSDEFKQDLSSFSEQVIRPQMVRLANEIDATILEKAVETMNSVGTPGTVPNALSTYLAAGVKLDQSACPRDGRNAVIGPQMQADIVDALKGLFHSGGRLSSQYESGEMAKAVGMNFHMDQNLHLHTVGPLGGTPLVNGASQTGASLITDGWTAAAAARLKKNDVFTIAGVYKVNPVTKESTGVLQQFRVTADVSSDGSGNLTAAIEPSIVTSGALQTVSGSPADNAAITVVGAASTLTAQGILGNKSAIALAFCPLPKPEGVDMASTKTDAKVGGSMRFVRWYDGDTDAFKCRFDVKFGVKVLRPEWLCRIQSGAA